MIKEPPSVSRGINKSWNMDFIGGSLTCGRKFRTLNIIDDHNTEALVVEIDISLPARRVMRSLSHILIFSIGVKMRNNTISNEII